MKLCDNMAAERGKNVIIQTDWKLNTGKRIDKQS